MSERKLNAWQSAGLIDADTVARIRNWEAQQAQPLGVWAIAGLGALAIGLGIVSVVAANWDAIPGEVRLGVHFALMAGFSALFWWRLPDTPSTSTYFSDSMLFVTSVLGLTFFGHLGQVYQTSSPLWQPLLAWLVIFSPLLLLFGRGWPVAGLWMAGVVGTACAHAAEYSGGSIPGLPVFGPGLYWGLIASPPMFVAVLAANMRTRSARPQFWRLLEQLAIFTILLVLSLFIIVSGWDRHFNSRLSSVAIQSLFLAGAGAAIYVARRNRSAMATAAILGAAAILHLGLATVLQSEGSTHRAWINALFFLSLWGVVAYGALYARWRQIFQCAIGFLAIRIIILSFELADDLLGSGVSLILSGIFAMCVAWIAVRISKRYAPQRMAEA